MGLLDRRPRLPAATESSIGPNVDSEYEEPLEIQETATDLSVQTDRTHHTIPDDGSPITIRTGGADKTKGKIFKTNNHNNQSQTSLLIEYFETGNSSDPNQKPSIRVKVHPSSNKSKDTTGHIVVQQGHSIAGDPSTRNHPAAVTVANTSRSLHTAGNSNPHQLQANDRAIATDDLSSRSHTPELRYVEASSDISSMPADSMLGPQRSTLISAPPQPRFAEISDISSIPVDDMDHERSAAMQPSTLQPPILPRERNLSNERITQKVIEKLSNRPKDTVKAGYTRDRSISGSTGRDAVPMSIATQQPRMTTGKSFKEDDSVMSSSERSALSNSNVYPSGRYQDQRSSRSIISNHSIQNNPKLLQTVEDAIKRLILPELKEIKKDQRHTTHRSKYDKDYSDLSTSSLSFEKTDRRISSGSKSRRRSSRDGVEHSTSRRRKSGQRDYDYDSLSDTSSQKRSISATGAEHKHRSSRRKDYETAAGVAGAALAANALQHQQSEDSLSHRRRRRRSKSRSSRSASVAESEEAYTKHKVPPMPMQSEIGSELTRSSILSSDTAGSQTPVQHNVREVARSSPYGATSSNNATPSRRSEGLRNTLGLHHGNFSEHNLSSNKLAYEQPDDDETLSPETNRGDFEYEPLEDPERMRLYERNLHTQHPIRRGLSPIQSVASYNTTELNRNSMMHPRSVDSFASARKRQEQLKKEVSISSFASASASPDLKTKIRPQGMSLENRSEIMHQHGHSFPQSPELHDRGLPGQYSESTNGAYRDSFATDNGDSYATDDHTLDSKRLSEMTDDTSDLMYVDKVTAGQHVKGGSANPAYIYTPPGAESAVASIVDPSVIESYVSNNSSSAAQQNRSAQSLSRDVELHESGSPLKREIYAHSQAGPVEERHAPNHSQTNFVPHTTQNYSPVSPNKQRYIGASPPQSPALSFEHHHGLHDQHTPNRNTSHSNLLRDEADLKESPRSEIITNPSIIQGPIGGHNAGRGDPWMHDILTPPMQSQTSMNRDFSSGAIDLIPEGLNVSQRNTQTVKPNTYVIGQQLQTPPGAKQDEGYVTGDNLPSPLAGTKANRDVSGYDLDDSFADMKAADDPFAMTSTKKGQYLSGLSQGMSPIYDNATGRGIERIQSKDIIALMDHLTVRDAQRNARDTEILVTLVRSAAEMRTSFEEMKIFIAEQDEMIMSTADAQHAQTQKVIGGPRPQPTRAQLSRNANSDEDMPTKRRNVFKRALAGLGSKNTAELQNIESMLMQLLDEVEALRAQTGAQPLSAQQSVPQQAVQANQQSRNLDESAYNAQNRAINIGTGTAANRPVQQRQHSATTEHAPDNRVSTIREQGQYNTGGYRSETPVSPIDDDEEDYQRHNRGHAVALNAPPGAHNQPAGARGVEHTPYESQRESKDTKHKSFASSFLPKMVSRWSKTTASTSDANYLANMQTKSHPYSQQYRSESDLQDYRYDEGGADDRYQDEQYYHDQEDNRPPSPLVPSAVSANDNPKYQAHRNSQNLVHPQPRQGPTGRYQSKLESAAQTYHDDVTRSPISQHSVPWDNNQHLSPVGQRQNDPSSFRMQAPLSPIPDAAYSPAPSHGERQERSGSASSLNRRTRSSKIADDEPLVPQRSNKIMSPSTYVDNVRAARAGSPALDKSPVNAVRRGDVGSAGRKPSGPRPLSSNSDRGQQVVEGKRTRFVTESPRHSEDGY